MTQLLILKAVAVFLRLKFKCRMRVQSKGGTSTKEVESDNGLYRFQEDITLELKGNCIELNFCLITEKGSKYSGGILKINLLELRSQRRTPLKMPISKCIDKEAWCEFEAIFDNTRRVTGQQEKSSLDQEIHIPPPSNRTHATLEPCVTQTKSQLYLPIPFNSFPRSFTRREAYHTARVGEKEKQDKSRNHSPTISFTNRTSPDVIDYRQKTEEAIQQAEFSMTRAKRMEAKLHQQSIRLKNEQEKRKSLEGKEHKQKIELLQLRMQKEQVDKELQKKDNQIKQLTTDILHFKRQERSWSDSQDTIRLLQDQLNKLHEALQFRDNQIAELKTAYQSDTNRLEGELKKVRGQRDKMKKIANEREDYLQGELKRNQEQLSVLKLRSACLEAEQQLSIKAKAFVCREEDENADVELKAQQQKHSLKKYIELLQVEAESKLSSLNRSNEALSLEISILKGELERDKGIYARLLHDKNLLQREQSEMVLQVKQCNKQVQMLRQSLEAEIGQKQTIRQDNMKLKNKFQQLLQEIQDLEKVRIDESQHNYQEIEILAEKYRQSEQTNRLLQQQLENHSIIIQKAQKAESALRNELSALRDREKKLKGQLSKKQTECIQTKAELDTLSHKILLKMDNSSHFTPNFSFLQQDEQLEDQRYDKLLSTLQSHQKYLEAQLNEQKIRNRQHASHISNLKESLSQLSNRESEWKQQERTYEKQADKLNTEVMQLSRQLKELQRKGNEQIYKLKSAEQQLEKEKNNQKALASKYQLVEKEFLSAQVEISFLKNQQANLREQSKQYEAQIESLKLQVQYLDRQRENYVKVKEELEFKLIATQDRLSLAAIQIKEEADTRVTQQKKHRQDLLRLDNQFKQLKSEKDKLNQGLRKIIVDYTPLKSSNSKSSLYASRKSLRGNISGLPPSSELLLQVQELLKLKSRQKAQKERRVEQLEKQLSETRQQAILSSNKSQNVEGQLRLKIQQLMCNFENMKTFYQERDQNMKKTLEQKQWDINCLTQQLKSYNEVKQHLSNQLNQKIEELAFIEHQNKQAACKSSQKISHLSDSLEQLTFKLQTLQSQYNKLEETNNIYRTTEESWHHQKNTLLLKFKQLKDSLKEMQGREAELSKLKAQIQQGLSIEQARVAQLTVVNKQLQVQIDGAAKQKAESHSLIRSLIKQKEQLLQQYLQSQQQKAQLQNTQYSLRNQLISVQQNLEDLRQKYEGANIKYQTLSQSNKQVVLQRQRLRQKIKQGEITSKEFSEKIQSLQAQLIQRQQALEKLTEDALRKEEQNKLLLSQKYAKIQELEASKTDYQQFLDTNKREAQQLIAKNEALKGQLAQQKRMNESMQNQLQANGLRLNELTKAERQYHAQLSSKQQELDRSMQTFRQVQAELEERDLKNYQLSSQLYRLQSQKCEDIDNLSSRIVEHEATILKYAELSQKLQEQLKDSLNELHTERQKSHSLEVELAKTASTVEALQQQIDNYREEVNKMLHESTTTKSIYKHKCLQLEQTENKYAEIIAQMKQQISRKQAQINRHRIECQTLRLTAKNNNENTSKLQLQLKEVEEKYSRLLENDRKNQQHLRILKDEINNLHWSCQREVKKTFGARLRSLQQTDIERNEGLDQWIKITEEGVIQTIRRLISFLK